MRALAILITAAAIHFGVSDTALAQTSVPNVTPPLTGLPTPLTSTTTTCMMGCNGSFALCQSSCIARALPPQGTIVAIRSPAHETRRHDDDPHLLAENLSGFGFHSRANFCASAICAGVISSSAVSRTCLAKSCPCPADRMNHISARTMLFGTPWPK